MKLTKKVIATMALASVILLGTQAGFTQPAGEVSSSVSWSFNTETRGSIQKVLEGNGANSVGLSSQSQKMLDRYGIEIGDTFYTRIHRVPVLVKRNSSGVEVLEVDHSMANRIIMEIPLQRTFEITPASYIPDNENSIPNITWFFDDRLTTKIMNRLDSKNNVVIVGLSTSEQRMLEEYNIEVGDSFHSYVRGWPCVVKRTSMGLKVEAIKLNLEVKKPSGSVASEDRG